MYELKRDNVHRIVATEAEKTRLLSEGFKEVEQPIEEPDKDKDLRLEDLTIPQLKEHAEKQGVDLKGATKKEEIIALLEGGKQDAGQ
ncbi:hypothetical protein [Paenibacillus gansuensis]|uniref:Rho termination factor N-terminal domain-containing protein n=1 Tax=Paenibacillus gansuensis TaxID=306542 RepID=A0ABW5PFP6_9BACL